MAEIVIGTKGTPLLPGLKSGVSGAEVEDESISGRKMITFGAMLLARLRAVRTGTGTLEDPSPGLSDY